MNISKKPTALIIGGGPSGCQCALWLKMLGNEPVIIEQNDRLGGLQALSPYQNHWIVGLTHTSGRSLAKHIQEHILSLNIPVLFNHKISSIIKEGKIFTVHLNHLSFETPFIVIATGSKPHSEIADTNQSHDDFMKTHSSTHRQHEWEANLPKALETYKTTLLDENGFIITNSECETPLPGIFAIGEAANRMHPCVVTSMADGVVAAKAIQNRL